MSASEKMLREAIRTRAFVRSTEAEPIWGTTGTVPLPWLFDLRAIMGEPAYLASYADAFWERHANVQTVQICGMETAGISLVAAILLRGAALGKDVNGLYLRKGRKKTGLLRIIEGTVRKNVPVIFVDDVINSGQSVRRALTILRDAQISVREVYTIIALRSPEAYSFLSDDHIHFRSLFTSADFDIPLKPHTEVVLPPYETVWKFASPQPNLRHVVPKSAPVIDDERIYFGSDNGTLWALNHNDGSVAWHYRVSKIPFRKGIFSTPAVHGARLFFGAYDGNVYALNTADGTEIWRYRDADWVGSSPALAPDLNLVFIGLEYGLWRKHGGIAALSLDTGNEVWVMREMPEFTHCTPVYIRKEKIVVIGSNDGVIYAFRARDGKPVWTFRTGGALKTSLVYDEPRRQIVFGSFDGNVYALNARTGEQQWAFQTGEVLFSTPCICGDTVYMPCLDKRLYALSLSDGSKRWHVQANGRLFAMPVAALGSIWFGSNDGVLREIDPRTGVLKSQYQVSERITNAVAIHVKTRRIFLPTQANEMYCIVKKETHPIHR